MTSRKERALDADPNFRKRNADFAAAWAERLARPVPPVLPSEFHRHTDACWVDRHGNQVAKETKYQLNAFVEGRVCQTKGMFVVERVVKNPTAVR